ncbi:MAG: hypothetical protein RIQ41_258 [Candidatus Parcubacteria bacterium]|jgi:hypothetical protein
MLIEEEEPKIGGEVNPDVLEMVLEDDGTSDETAVAVFLDEDEQVDEIDIAFQANDEGYW